MSCRRSLLRLPAGVLNVPSCCSQRRWLKQHCRNCKWSHLRKQISSGWGSCQLTGPGRSVAQWLFSLRQMLWWDCFGLKVNVECWYFNIDNIQVYAHYFLVVAGLLLQLQDVILRKLCIQESLPDSRFHIKGTVMWATVKNCVVRWLLTQNKTIALYLLDERFLYLGRFGHNYILLHTTYYIPNSPGRCEVSHFPLKVVTFGGWTLISFCNQSN